MKTGLTNKSSNKAINLIVGILGSFVICCVGILAISAITNKSTTTSPVILPTSVPIETLIAGTSSAAQTQTAVVSVPSKAPIQIQSTQQPTSQSTSKDEILSYARTINTYATEYIADMETMGTLLQEIGTDSYLLFDTTWNANISVALAEMQISGRRLGNMQNVPVELEQADYWFKQMSVENELLITNITAGVHTLDITSINLANDNIHNVNLFFENGMDEMTRVLSSLSNTSIEPTATIFIFQLQTNVAQPTEYIYSTNTPFALATQPLQTIQPTLPPQSAVCSCSSDSLNCTDFSSHSSAQACFNYCISQGAGDIHGLDRDSDGSACE